MGPESPRDQCNKDGCKGCKYCADAERHTPPVSSKRRLGVFLEDVPIEHLEAELVRRKASKVADRMARISSLKAETVALRAKRDEIAAELSGLYLTREECPADHQHDSTCIYCNTY